MLERHQNVQKLHFINIHFQKVKHLEFQYSVLIQTYEFIYLNLDRETAVPISAKVRLGNCVLVQAHIVKYSTHHSQMFVTQHYLEKTVPQYYTVLKSPFLACVSFGLPDSLILVQTGENHARLGFWRKERSFLYRCCLFHGCTRRTFVSRDESSCPVDTRAFVLHHHQLDWLLGFHGNLQNTLLTGIFPSTVIEHARDQENQKQDHIAGNQNDQVQGHRVKL
ncbi:hypothetical protein E2320_016088 [Naja naja]|nr:hypothetical protein E2320_016088 [Naja naja]